MEFQKQDESFINPNQRSVAHPLAILNLILRNLQIFSLWLESGTQPFFQETVSINQRMAVQHPKKWAHMAFGAHF
jgi:hypothetical protein